MKKSLLISLLWLGAKNVIEFQPIIDTPEFKKLDRRKQDGFTNIIFPGAKHCRGEVLLVTALKTKELMEIWRTKKIVDADEARNIILFSLLHDIGHGPFSHVIEAITKINHEERGLELIPKIEKAVRQCGGSPQFIKDCLTKKNPFYIVVDDKILGTDKLIYLRMDQLQTGVGPDIEKMIQRIFESIEYRDEKLMIDVRALPDAMMIQSIYNYEYKNVYLEKDALKVQRFMQKMIYKALRLPKEKGGITENELWEMTDEDLISILKNCKDPTIQFGMQIYDLGINQFPKTAIAIRPKKYGKLEGIDDKPIYVKEVEEEFFAKFSKKSTPHTLENLEAEIAKILEIEPHHITVTAILLEDKKRFVPEDILFFDGEKKYSIREEARKSDDNYFRSYLDTLNKEVDTWISTRVCISPDLRKHLYLNSEKVTKFLIDFVME